MAWTYNDWILCNILSGLGIVLLTCLILGILAWRFHSIFYSMVAKLLNIHRCIIDVNHKVVHENAAIYTPSATIVARTKFASKLCHCCTPYLSNRSKVGAVMEEGGIVEKSKAVLAQTTSEPIPRDHPSHPEHARAILNVYGKYLSLNKRRNRLLITALSVIIISSIIIAGFEGCVLSSTNVYQNGPCPAHGASECFHGNNHTYFECQPNEKVIVQLLSASASCFRWIITDRSISDVMAQIAICTSLLTALGSVAEAVIRLLLYVLQQRRGVSAGIRRIMEKTVGINKITQPSRICGFQLPFHFGVLHLGLYEHPWLVVVLIILYTLLPALVVAAFVLLSYFRISVTSLTYIILLTLVLLCSLALIWILWEENEIGKIIPGGWTDFGEVLKKVNIAELALLRDSMDPEGHGKRAVSELKDTAGRTIGKAKDMVPLELQENEDISSVNGENEEQPHNYASKSRTRPPTQAPSSSEANGKLRERR